MKTLNQFLDYLKKFNLDEKTIAEYVQGKKFFSTMQGNVYLNTMTHKGQNIYGDGLVFVQLKRLLPSKFLLLYLHKQSKNILKIKSEKQALNFVYGKDLSLNVIEEPGKLDPEKYYLVEFEGKVLGYTTYTQGTNFELKNEMHIGEYLKEN